MINEKIIFVFPGQGAQRVGMAKDLFDEYDVVRHTFEQVSDLSHKNISKACFEGQNLDTPILTSLGTFAHSISIARILEKQFFSPLYNIGYAMTGHSMGQYSALHCVGSLSIENAIDLLSERSNYMSMAGIGGGGMGCISGLSRQEVEDCLLAANSHGYVAISNHNAVDQFTVSGQNDALDLVLKRAKDKGARVKRLAVSIPAHCELMRNAEYMLRDFLKSVNVQPPKTNWFSNQTGNVMSNPQDIKDALADQMTHGVRWLDIMEKLPQYNITTAYELGPGRTLSGLIRRANVGVKTYSTDNLKNVRAMIEQISNSMSR